MNQNQRSFNLPPTPSPHKHAKIRTLHNTFLRSNDPPPPIENLFYNLPTSAVYNIYQRDLTSPNQPDITMTFNTLKKKLSLKQTEALNYFRSYGDIRKCEKRFCKHPSPYHHHPPLPKEKKETSKKVLLFYSTA